MSEPAQVKHFQLKKEDNYASSFQVNPHITVPCYSKKQMKALYPNQKPKLAGEYAPRSRQQQVGEVEAEQGAFPVYGQNTHSRWIYAEKGFVRCQQGDKITLVALLKNVAFIRILALIIAVAVVVAGVIAIPRLASVWNTGEPVSSQQSGGVDLDENAMPWDGGDLPADNNAPASGGIKIPGYESVTIKADRQDVTMSLVNPAGNPCYFEVSLVLTDTSEVLYKSKKIAPGYGIKQIRLTHGLPQGVYDAKVQYDTYSLTDQTPLNGAEVKIKLIVQ